ncbi:MULTISPECIES: hypothetical protein [unclassified Bacillus (in: firmicutes)]|jgi:hypothetical protein|uniref:hypothetical protein n=1 Tax=unclassified Bacillus (in: firmicutes) TaxID=185979 RepID=UPI0008EC467B|nr:MULTISPECIES: hypothetical protein [unclassified Bacillus (in: firmicutes)]PGZ85271.1 hypothetical protein COE53_23290 [Bacillus sp. AFS029533]SFD51630.1 hypothetical protein SAMN02799633_04045 [Bacillus sp. UNCCL81]
MSFVSIAINNAIMIESLRSAGVENIQLINAVKEENFEFLNQYGNGFPDWETLIKLYKNNEENFNKIVNDGYQIKFLTKGSLMTLLRYKFGIEVEKDYEDMGTAIQGIYLSEEAINLIKHTLAANWSLSTYVDEKDGLKKIRIELVKGSEAVTK